MACQEQGCTAGGGQVSKASSAFTTAPHRWASPPVGPVSALDSHRSTNPTVNYACEGSLLYVPYENRPETILTPPLVYGNIVFPKSTKLTPGAKKG